MKNKILAIFVCLLWGTAFASVKFGLSYLTPLHLCGVRFTLAGIFLIPLLIYKKTDWNQCMKEWRFLLKFAFIQTVIQYSLFNFGLDKVAAAVSAIIIGIGPLMAAVMAHIFLPNDKLTVKKSVAIALGILGVVFISLSKGFDGGSLNLEFWIGLTCLFLSCASGFYADITVKKYSGKLSPYVLAAMGNLLGGIIIYVLAVIIGEGTPIKPLDMPFYLNMIWLGIIPAATFAIWYSLISQPGVKVSELNIWRFSIPLSGAVISWIALKNETPDMNTIIGMIIICSSLLVLNITPRKRG